ncbi:MAG: putative sugar nucleotidyl transferase [Nitrososphaerales archaeon]|nr:putative sugar nucleotidyl transferase [Nitrososphaerales archaeon]
MIVAIFEDEKWDNLLPMSLMHPTWGLRCGTSSLYEKIHSKFNDFRILLFTRDYLARALNSVNLPINEPDKIDDHTLLLNGRVLMDSRLSAQLKNLPLNTIGMKGDTVIFAYISERVAKQISQMLCKPLSQNLLMNLSRELDNRLSLDWVKMIDYPWDLINQNPFSLLDDVPKDGCIKGKVEESVKILGPLSQLTVNEGSVVEAGSIIDVRKGPVLIDRDVEVQPLSYIKGPCYIGSGTIVYGARITGNCSIGEVCRVGGEIEDTIIHGYSNKRHHGYIGHSYIGEWVNIGAGATNSNLKNTYGTVRMKIKDSIIDTNSQFVGCFIGDHAKVGINVSIMAGKKVGIFSHVLGFVDDDVPPFTIWAKSLGKGAYELFLSSAIDIQRRVFERRGRVQTRRDIDLIEYLFYMTSRDRERCGVMKGTF